MALDKTAMPDDRGEYGELHSMRQGVDFTTATYYLDSTDMALSTDCGFGRFG